MVKVSVIIPTFNTANLIDKAVGSVLKQTYSDIEVIIVDDGSTDNTSEVIKSFDDKRIIYVYQHNQSQAVARNKGISLSSGEFIAFLDADDYWEQNKLERQLKLLKNNKTSLIYSKVNFINESNKEIQKRNRIKYYKGDVLKSLIKSNFITCSSVIVRKKILGENLYFFREGRQGVEDWDFWIRLAMITEFDYVNEPLVNYRVYKDNISNNQDLMFAGQIKALDNCLKDYRFISKCPDKRIINQFRKSKAFHILKYAHWLLKNKRHEEAKNFFLEALMLNKTKIRNWWGIIKYTLKSLKS